MFFSYDSFTNKRSAVITHSRCDSIATLCLEEDRQVAVPVGPQTTAVFGQEFIRMRHRGRSLPSTIDLFWLFVASRFYKAELIDAVLSPHRGCNIATNLKFNMDEYTQWVYWRTQNWPWSKSRWRDIGTGVNKNIKFGMFGYPASFAATRQCLHFFIYKINFTATCTILLGL